MHTWYWACPGHSTARMAANVMGMMGTVEMYNNASILHPLRNAAMREFAQQNESWPFPPAAYTWIKC